MRNLLSLFVIFAIAPCIVLAQGIVVNPNTNIKIHQETTLKINVGNLVLQSNENGDASFIDLGTLSYTNGETIVERYLTHGKWHLISAPVNNAIAGQFEQNYLQYFTEGSNSWSDINSLTYELNSMQGYALWLVNENPVTEIFSGTTHTGNYQLNFTQSGQGFNLFGNPYPSAIDWDAVSLPTELSNAFWLFDPTIGTNGDYQYYINGGGGANTTSQYIPSGQGFFVRATNGAGSLQLTNAARAHINQAFYKNILENQMLVLKAAGNNITTQTAIRFNEEATAQVDVQYDVFRMFGGSPDVPLIYTMIDNENMAINTLPSIEANETIPVFFRAGITGTYSINATAMESIPDSYPVYLEDTELNIVQDMRIHPEYTFNYIADQTKEFKVHFKEVTGIESPFATGKLAINCYLTNGVLHVNFLNKPAVINNAIISVYNISGQKMLSCQTSQPKNEIIFNGSQSVYIVHITSGSSHFSNKVFNR